MTSGQMHMFEPESTWTPLDRPPSVPRGAVVAIDTETRDDGLSQNRGAGWVYHMGWISGVSIAWNDQAHYLPLRHPDTACLDKSVVLSWLEHTMRQARRVIFHNAAYDCGWLSSDGVSIPWEAVDDTQVMAVMVDENRDAYNLDACCRWRGVEGKNERLLREAAAAYGLDPKSQLWQLPGRHVGPYAEQDARATLSLYNSLVKEIELQDLTAAYQLEIDLIPMVMSMRRRGIRIDESGADKATADIRRQRDEKLEHLRSQIGWRRIGMDDLLSPASLERMFSEQSVEFPRTPKTNRGSFKREWMESSEHWLPRAVVGIRQLDDLAEKFLQTYIVGSSHLGRVHAEVHQLRDDEGGTRSYRFSYSDPPLQQIPARSKMAPLIRGVFLPEEGELWCAADYSQQEPRVAVHFAAVCRRQGAEQAVAYYRDNPAADFHTMVAELTGVPRKDAKIINLGLMYGMGLAKLARSLGVEMSVAGSMMDQYNARMPFVRALSEFCTSRADMRGYIRLLDGARCRFDLWEPRWRGDVGYTPPSSRETMLARHPSSGLRRAYTHKAMNRLIQGSSARQTKMAMRACWREGLLPLLQMHDELDFSIVSEEQAQRIGEIMCSAVTLEVPMKVDLQFGHTWGQASEEMPKGVAPPSMQELLLHGRGVSNSDIVRLRGA